MFKAFKGNVTKQMKLKQNYIKLNKHRKLNKTAKKAVPLCEPDPALFINDYESLRELLLLEEFKNGVLERVIVYLNERTVSTVSQKAVLTDEFVLTHKQAFKSVIVAHSSDRPKPKAYPPQSQETRECF